MAVDGGWRNRSPGQRAATLGQKHIAYLLSEPSSERRHLSTEAAASIGLMAHAHPLRVVLDDDHDARLMRMAERIAVDRDDLAGSLLASVLDGAETDGGELTCVLDAIPGAWERAELGRAQGEAGRSTPLDQL
jgi:hypothetical protein